MRGQLWVRTAQVTLLLVCGVGITFGFVMSWKSGITLLPAVVYAAVGLVVTVRKPSNPIGWLFLGVGGVYGLIGAANAAMALAEHFEQPDAWYALAAAWASNFLWIDGFTLAIALTLLLFPNGLLTSRWRPVLWLTVGACVAATVEAALAPTLSVGTETFPNPLHPGAWGAVARGTWTALLVTLSICGLLALVSTILRFRRATGVERVQMRWFAFSGAILVVTFFIPGLNDNDLVFAVASSLIPLACGVAIMRYHLYDIDRIVSRTTSYVIVTGLLLATYAAIVGAAGHFLHTDSPLLVAAATLAAAALARPALRRVQTVVDRRFNRARYDAMRTVDAFGTRLRHQVDPHQVSDDLVAIVDGTLQPAHTTLWIRQPS